MRRLSLALALGFALGCSGLFTPGPGSGTRVVVVRHGAIDTANDLGVAQGVADILADRGFLVTVVPEALPADSADPDMDARWVASAAGAANAVLLSMSTRELREGLEPGTDHHEVRLDARVVNLDLEATPAEQTLVFASEDTGPVPVARRTAAHWVEATGGFAVRQLFVTPEVGEVSMGARVPIAEINAAEQLRRRERQVAESAERAYAYEAFCEEQEALVASFADEGLTCVGDPCGGWSLLGVAGDEALVQDARRVLWFDVPVRDDPSWSEPPERVLAVDLASGEPRVLLEAQNLYGLGHVLPGAAVGTMDWFSASGHEGIVGFDVATGERRLTVLLGKGERTDVVSVAPDGSAAAWCLRDGGDCFIDQGDRRAPLMTMLEPSWVATANGPVWVGQNGSDLVSVAVDGTTRRTRLRGRLRDVVSGPDGLAVVVLDEGDCHYLEVDAVGWTVGKAESLPSCPWHVSPLPGGGLVGIADATAGGDDLPGDSEVVRWRPGDEAWDVVTRGSYREEFPFALPDGRLVFNRRLARAPRVVDTEVYRRVVCTTGG